MIVVPRRAACIVRAAESSAKRTITASVRVKEYLDQYWVEATNGRLLAIARGPMPDADGLMPPMLDGEWSREYHVPTKFYQDAFKGVEEAVGFASDGKIVCAVLPNGCLETHTQDEVLARLPEHERRGALLKFPDFATVIAGAHGLFAATISAEYLRDIADMANAFARRDDANPTVRIVWAGFNKPLIWHVIGQDGHILEGVLNPCFDDDPASIGYPPGTQEEVLATFAKPNAKPNAKRKGKR